MESLVNSVIAIVLALVVFLVIKKWLNREPAELTPLPSLGFSPKLYDVETAPKHAVVIRIENDDETPIEFVACVIRDYFNFDIESAFEMMWQVHTEGAGDIRAASREDAQKLIDRIHEVAETRGFPLRCGFRDS